MPTPRRRRYAASPSTRPTRRKSFAEACPRTNFSLSSWWNAGRPDWLESACRQGIRCDVLVISGHYDGGNEFYSDRLDAREYLPVAEMERVSCSDSCSGLFSQLKEVYLFGCNTLNPEALKRASSEIGRSLVRSGYSRADAERLSRALSARHGESSRDRMRLIFKDVPVIYGFSSKAPLGPVAASMLDRHFQSGAGSEVGSGRASARLLGRFAANSMVVTSGVRDSDPRRGTSARRLPILRRSLVACAEGPLRPSTAESRDGGSAHVPRPYREICGVAQRERAASARGCPGTRRDRAR